MHLYGPTQSCNNQNVAWSWNAGTSSSKDQRQQDQVRRSLRVRRGNPRPSYEERSESDLDEPSSDANGNNWPACSRGKHRPAAEAQPLETLAPPEPVNQQYQQREPEEDDKMSSWAAVGLRTQRFRQRFDPLRRMGNTSEPPCLFLFCMLIPRECLTVTSDPACNWFIWLCTRAHSCCRSIGSIGNGVQERS